MSTSGLLAWGLAFWAVYLLKRGFETEPGKQLVQALADRIRRPRPD